jgi:hypothetical protein
MTFPLIKRLAAECLGTGLLVATVVGSGIMAEKLAGGNVALALLGNTLPTGAILVVLILALGQSLAPISTRRCRWSWVCAKSIRGTNLHLTPSRKSSVVASAR